LSLTEKRAGVAQSLQNDLDARLISIDTVPQDAVDGTSM